MLSLRYASPEDAAALSTLARQTYGETFTHYRQKDLDRFLDEHYSSAAWLHALERDGNVTWIVELEGTPAGYARIGPYELPLTITGSRGVLELHRLYVLQSAQGLGVGSFLMARVVAEAITRKAEALYLSVWERNTKAQKFYEHYGFAKVGEYDYPPIGDVVDREWILRKSVR